MWHNLKFVGCYEGGNKEASSLSEIRDRSELSGEGSMDQGTQKSGHAKSHGATWRRNRCWGGGDQDIVLQSTSIAKQQKLGIDPTQGHLARERREDKLDDPCAEWSWTT